MSDKAREVQVQNGLVICPACHGTNLQYQRTETLDTTAFGASVHVKVGGGNVTVDDNDYMKSGKYPANVRIMLRCIGCDNNIVLLIRQHGTNGGVGLGMW